MYLVKNLMDRLEKSTLVTDLRVSQSLSFDNSTFTNWQGCFVKGVLFSGIKRVSARQQAPLRFGSAVHEGLAARLSGKSNEKALAIALHTADENKLHECLDDRRNHRTLVSLLTSYFLHCDITNSWITPVVLDDKPLVEQAFEFNLGHVMIEGLKYFNDGHYLLKWKGKIDVVERYNGDLWIVDHKTTTVMGEKFIDDKVRGSQMLGYTWAGRHFAVAFNERVKGVRINALAMRSNGFEFKMFQIPYSDVVIDAWHAETIAACVQHIRALDALLARAANSDTLIVPNRESCVTKYGRCPYFDACDTMPVMMQRMLDDDTLFTDNVWDPLNE